MKAWIKEHTEGMVMVTLVLLMFVAIGIYELTRPEPVQAASPSASGSMCVPMGVVGNVIISRCEDEDTGAILYANSAGYMLLGE